jgi:hypothetical protein
MNRFYRLEFKNLTPFNLGVDKIDFILWVCGFDYYRWEYRRYHRLYQNLKNLLMAIYCILTKFGDQNLPYSK